MLGPLLDIKINNTLVTRAKSVGLRSVSFLPPHAMHEAGIVGTLSAVFEDCSD